MPAKTRPVFRIVFLNQGNVYELHARKVSQGSLFTFVEVEEILFGERTNLLVDPSEERLKVEFQGVKRTFIPLQSVVRIDEVSREGTNKITPLPGGAGNVTPFPVTPLPVRPPPKD